MDSQRHIGDLWDPDDLGLNSLFLELYGAAPGSEITSPPTQNCPPKAQMATSANLRVAIAGTGGLARHIAHSIFTESSHHLLLLSRTPQPELVAQGYQVMTVNYDDPASLQFALAGVDVVISTVPGLVQINLIDASVAAGVRRFAPAEYEGHPRLRIAGLDSLDRGKADVLEHLRLYRNRLESAVFVCGVLYERFAPGGLHGARIGLSSGIGLEGDYMMNPRYMTARIPLNNAVNQHVSLCLTAAQDVGRFVARALDLEHWPDEMSMCGERMTTYALLRSMEHVRGRQFHPNIRYHSPGTLQSEAQKATSTSDIAELWRILELQATAEGRYDFGQPYLNTTFGDVVPVRFQDWLSRVWAGQ